MVPGVWLGVADGLVSSDGGKESPAGPTENRGPVFGCGATALSDSTCGDAERSGVMRSATRDFCAVDSGGTLAVVPPVMAGVSGGECMADTGGDGCGEGASEPAGILLDGVVAPEGI